MSQHKRYNAPLSPSRNGIPNLHSRNGHDVQLGHPSMIGLPYAVQTLSSRKCIAAMVVAWSHSLRETHVVGLSVNRRSAYP